MVSTAQLLDFLEPAEREAGRSYQALDEEISKLEVAKTEFSSIDLGSKTQTYHDQLKTIGSRRDIIKRDLKRLDLHNIEKGIITASVNSDDQPLAQLEACIKRIDGLLPEIEDWIAEQRRIQQAQYEAMERQSYIWKAGISSVLPVLTAILPVIESEYFMSSSEYFMQNIGISLVAAIVPFALLWIPLAQNLRLRWYYTLSPGLVLLSLVLNGGGSLIMFAMLAAVAQIVLGFWGKFLYLPSHSNTQITKSEPPKTSQDSSVSRKIAYALPLLLYVAPSLWFMFSYRFFYPDVIIRSLIPAFVAIVAVEVTARTTGILATITRVAYALVGAWVFARIIIAGLGFSTFIFAFQVLLGLGMIYLGITNKLPKAKRQDT